MKTDKPKLLFVDDEPQLLNSLRWLFQRDYRITLAHDGASAIALLEDGDFDVIVCDQRMPRINGTDVLRAAAQRAPRTMRILLTGYADLQATIKSVNEGEVFRYVTKPWDNGELKEVIRQAVEAAHQAPSASRVTSPPPARAEHLLVLDDDPDTASAIRSLLDNRCVVHHASDAEGALVILGSHPVGVVVSDTVVGNNDVTALINLLKHHHPQIVSVVFTAHSDAYVVMDLINKGQVFRFLQKPIRCGQYRLAIQAAIRKHRELVAHPAQVRRHQVATHPANPTRRMSHKDDGLWGRLVDRVRSLPNRLFA